MKRLYQKIYITIIASLLLVVLVAGAVWRLGADRMPVAQAFEMAGGAAGPAAAPPPAAPPPAARGRCRARRTATGDRAAGAKAQDRSGAVRFLAAGDRGLGPPAPATVRR